MRSEIEMLNLIRKTAEDDPRVRAVAMNGSRTNRNVRKDPFMDFDAVYVVEEMDSFLADPDWIDVFGERIMMQTPEDTALFQSENNGRFTYLMLFADGNRIDLKLIPIEQADAYCQEDSLTMILLDKDGCLPELSPPSDRKYWVQKPSAAFYADCCNEFWWVSAYVAKGLWRREILYALDHLAVIRSMLIKMMEWKAGAPFDFSVSTGKSSKYLERYICKDQWRKLMLSFPEADYERVWDALFVMIELFEEAARETAEELCFSYPAEEAGRMKKYLGQVKLLPENATEIG